MTIRPRKKRKAPEYQNDVEKNQAAIRAVVAKRNQLGARQQAMRVVGRSIGGNPAQKAAVSR